MHQHELLQGMPGGPMHGMSLGHYSGRVKSYNPKQGYGFIDCPEAHAHYGRDVFIHKAQMGELLGRFVGPGTKLDAKTLSMWVRFSVEINKQGMPQARDVYRLQESAPPMPYQQDMMPPQFLPEHASEACGLASACVQRGVLEGQESGDSSPRGYKGRGGTIRLCRGDPSPDMQPMPAPPSRAGAVMGRKGGRGKKGGGKGMFVMDEVLPMTRIHSDWDSLDDDVPFHEDHGPPDEARHRSHWSQHDPNMGPNSFGGGCGQHYMAPPGQPPMVWQATLDDASGQCPPSPPQGYDMQSGVPGVPSYSQDPHASYPPYQARDVAPADVGRGFNKAMHSPQQFPSFVSVQAPYPGDPQSYMLPYQQVQQQPNAQYPPSPLSGQPYLYSQQQMPMMGSGGAMMQQGSNRQDYQGRGEVMGTGASTPEAASPTGSAGSDEDEMRPDIRAQQMAWHEALMRGHCEYPNVGQMYGTVQGGPNLGWPEVSGHAQAPTISSQNL